MLLLNPQGSAIIYSTFIGGGAEDEGSGIAVDALGNAYVTGGATSPDFPFVNPVAGGTCSPDMAPFVAKLNSAGSSLVYSTCLGSGNSSIGNAIAVDDLENAYVTGQTIPRDLVVLNAAQPSGGGNFDAFVSKLSASGSLIYSTYLGGGGQELGFGIAADHAGNGVALG